MRIQYIVPDTLTAMPARVFLQKLMLLSGTQWKRMKRSRSFAINGICTNPSLAIVKPGDSITYEYTIEGNSSITPADLPIEICYEDDWLLIVNKPAGQLVHPTVKNEQDTLANAVMGYYRRINQPYAFHPVYRLDRQTSGLLLIAKLPQLQPALSSHERLQRSYLALTEGRLQPPDGRIDAPIARRTGSIIERCISPAGQPAVTDYHTLAASSTHSLLQLQLQTGRTHQIRVHLAYQKHPLMGDDLYGGDCRMLHRQALHSWKLKFIHPVTKESLQCHAPLPEDLKKICTFLGISYSFD